MNLKLRLEFDNGLVLGPGKVAPPQTIAREGAISAAGRVLGKSYKRAWGLIDDVNEGFAEPVVSSPRGGAKGGGAAVTEFGQQAIARFRAVESRVLQDGAGDVTALCDMALGK